MTKAIKKNIVILKKGNVCYGSTSYFANRLNEEFVRAGIKSAVVEINSKEAALEFVEKYVGLKEVSDIIDFNTDIYSYVFERENSEDNKEKYIFDIKNDRSGYINLWHVILDHPLYHNSVLKTKLQNLKVVCLDETHADYIRKHYNHIRKVCVMPLPADTAKNLIPYNERSREVIFTGTYTSSEDVVALAMKSGEIGMAIFKKMADYLLNNPQATIENAFDNAIYIKEKAFENAIHKKEKAFDNVIYENDEISEKNYADKLELNFMADMFIRAVIREELLMEMLRNGIDVDIFGHGWEKFVEKCRSIEKRDGEFKGKINICGEAEYEKLPEIYADSKIALNVLPWFKAGQHDRIALAMCNGCVCVSDDSDYLEKNFTDGENIFMYSLEDMGEAAKLVKSLKAQPFEAAKAAAKGYACAIHNLSFKTYSKLFL